MKEMAAIEALKSEKSDKEVCVATICFFHSHSTHNLQRELQQLTDTSGASGHQKLRVCDVCGAYLSVLDSDRRLADHFGGKVSYWLFIPYLKYSSRPLKDALRLPRTPQYASKV